MTRLLAGVALGAAAVLAAAPASAQAGERIRGYDVELRVDANGVLQVTERIDYDFGTADKHGIVREIPERSRYDNSRDRIIRVTVLTVRATAGTPAQFETSANGPALDVRIGDPDRTISGRHGYTIVYRVEGALNGFADHDELYWNAVGPEWSVPIDRASAHVIAPAGISRVTGYRGPPGSRQPIAGQRIEGSSAWFTDTGLAARDAFTVVVAFPPGVVPTPTPILQERWSAARAFAITPLTGGLFGILSLLAVVAGSLVLRSGRDRRPGGLAGIDGSTAAFVEYRPPDGVPPGLAGLLVRESVDPIDVTATIVDLAARRYLNIEDVGAGTDWRLVRLKDPDDGLLPYERLLFDALFSTGMGRLAAEVLMSGLKDRFAEHYHAVRGALYAEAMGRGWFVARPDRVRLRGLLAGGLLFAVGAGLTVLAAVFTHLGLVPVPIALAGLAIVIGAWWLPRRTATGRALFQRVTAFRSYLRDVAFAASAGDRPDYPMDEYLAYAMVFGLTSQWRNAITRRTAVHASPYLGTYVFLSPGFADHADDFSHSWGDTLTSTPSSSSSGFGGSGGFSGGGGGGGGGGSW